MTSFSRWADHTFVKVFIDFPRKLKGELFLQIYLGTSPAYIRVVHTRRFAHSFFALHNSGLFAKLVIHRSVHAWWEEERTPSFCALENQSTHHHHQSITHSFSFPSHHEAVYQWCDLLVDQRQPCRWICSKVPGKPSLALMLMDPPTYWMRRERGTWRRFFTNNESSIFFRTVVYWFHVDVSTYFYVKVTVALHFVFRYRYR